MGLPNTSVVCVCVCVGVGVCGCVGVWVCVCVCVSICLKFRRRKLNHSAAHGCNNKGIKKNNQTTTAATAKLKTLQ